MNPLRYGTPMFCGVVIQLEDLRCETQDFPLFQGLMENVGHKKIVVKVLSPQVPPEPALHGTSVRIPVLQLDPCMPIRGCPYVMGHYLCISYYRSQNLFVVLSMLWLVSRA